MEQITIQARSGDSLELKGDTIICDPCYFFSTKHHVWTDLVNQMFKPGNEAIRDSGIATVTRQGHEFSFIYTKTAYGDGVYDMTVLSSGARIEGTEIGVDAGLICAVLRSDAESFDLEFRGKEMGMIIKDFDGTVMVNPDEGVLFGEGNVKFAVETGHDEWEEDEDEEEWEEED